jgi:shikimate kinase/3-dehydroquinate synthase
MKTNLFLYGPPGSGKTTTGKLLAELLQLPFYDLDAVIESTAGKTISEIFSTSGESAFRILERECLRDLLDSHRRVIALGGGTLLNPDNRSMVEACGKVLCLSANQISLVDRIQEKPGKRPLLGTANESPRLLMELLDERAGHYDSFPLRLDTSLLSIQEAAGKAMVQFGSFRLSGMGKGYEIIVQEGGVDYLGEILHLQNHKGPIAIVSDSNVAPLYANQIQKTLEGAGYKVEVITILAGESSKTITNLEYLWRGFLTAGLDRSSTVIALGGGVVGDLAGFAAATFMRGIPWVVIPTSLLAMVDSSLGGKTGIDLPLGKNLAGAFHSPNLVLSDPQLLVTLPEIELKNGMAEIVKHGVIADPGLFNRCGSGLHVVSKNWDNVVRLAMAVKVQYVQTDPFEGGIRAALNFGHTLGHAIEKGSGYKLHHGEAVSIGMVYETRLSEKIGIARTGLAKDISGVLRGMGLPVDIPAGMDRDQLISDIQYDKKKKNGLINFSLPVEIGEIKTGVAVSKEDMEWMITN